MLDEILLFITLFLTGFILFLIGIYTSNAILTLISSAIFFITAILPGAIITDTYLFMAASGIILLLAITALIYTFYQWWAAYTATKGWHKWNSFFVER
jgi:hypothetical membrane protein